MGRRVAFAWHVTVGDRASCNCAASADEMDGFDVRDLSVDELRALLYNASLSGWRYYFSNPLNNFPHLWRLAAVIRQVLAEDLVDIDIEVKSDIFDIIAEVRFNLGDPLSIGRFCALCAWCAHNCKRKSFTDTWKRCGELARALKSCLR